MAARSLKKTNQVLTPATAVVSKVKRSLSTFVVLLVAVLALFQPLATRMLQVSPAPDLLCIRGRHYL